MGNMKLELAFVVIFLSGWSLSHPQKLRPGRLSHLSSGASAPVLRHLGRDQPVDKFNFIDLELLELAAEAETGNIILSPASVKTTLSMLWEGADGRSAQEIGLALRLSGRREHQEDVLHRYQQNLTARSSTLSGEMALPSSTLEVASQVFVSDRVAINPMYSDALANYHAMAQTVNMSDPQQAAGAVNKWVNTATHGLVPTLVEPDSMHDNPVMVLANAIYFQGRWQTAFDAQLTQDACFYADPTPAAPAGECVKVQMMETMGSFRSKLLHELEATLLELPYDDGRYSMLVLLPERRDGMPQLMRNLAFANLLHVLNDDLEDSEYVVSLPKFTIEYNTDLVPVLNKLRVVDIFTPMANLTRMVKQDMTNVVPAVSNVFHKAKIMVDERGAVAAGASGALVVPLMGGPQPRFRADHPFLFFIRDVRTGGFLFAGRVSRPKVEASAKPVLSENEATAPALSASKRMQVSQQVKESDINFPSTSRQ